MIGGTGKHFGTDAPPEHTGRADSTILAPQLQTDCLIDSGHVERIRAFANSVEGCLNSLSNTAWSIATGQGRLILLVNPIGYAPIRTVSNRESGKPATEIVQHFSLKPLQSNGSTEAEGWPASVSFQRDAQSGHVTVTPTISERSTRTAELNSKVRNHFESELTSHLYDSNDPVVTAFEVRLPQPTPQWDWTTGQTYVP